MKDLISRVPSIHEKKIVVYHISSIYKASYIDHLNILHITGPSKYIFRNLMKYGPLETTSLIDKILKEYN